MIESIDFGKEAVNAVVDRVGADADNDSLYEKWSDALVKLTTDGGNETVDMGDK